jgi:transcription initiation factor TFIIH subunit 1
MFSIEAPANYDPLLLNPNTGKRHRQASHVYRCVYIIQEARGYLECVQRCSSSDLDASHTQWLWAYGDNTLLRNCQYVLIIRRFLPAYANSKYRSDLRQSPASSSKASIQLLVQRAGAPSQDTHVFTFTSPATAKADQAKVVEALKKGIEANRNSATNAKETGGTPAPHNGTTAAAGSSAAMAIAQALATGSKAEDAGFDDAQLLRDQTLQQSLLGRDAALLQRFKHALQDKPENISVTQFAQQFWSTRIHLLREHAVEKSQSQGTTNVLSEVKTKNVDGTIRLSISKEQIQLIFKQHPLVRRVYDENVPTMSEMDFWSRFFVSRLFKKLKGEKITEMDSTDPKLDKYLNFNEDEDRTKQLEAAQVPNFMNLEGNEQNHSQRKGNAPDFTMKPNSNDKVPILRVLNQMSEKLMADVAPTDATLHAPVGMDEETFNEVRLRDLQKDTTDNRMMLQIKDQMRFRGGESGSKTSAEAARYSKQDPRAVLSVLKGEARHLTHANNNKVGIDLEDSIGVREDSSDEEEADGKASRMGGRFGRSSATKQIVDSIRQHRAQTDDFSASSGTFAAVQSSKVGLSNGIVEAVIMTHNTTIEFLQYFWSVFYSGDADRAGQAEAYIQTLDRSLDRMNAVAEKAEDERKQQIEKIKAQYEESSQRTGRKRVFNPSQVKGGAQAVNQLLEPTKRTIRAATNAYKNALRTEQSMMHQLQPPAT